MIVGNWAAPSLMLILVTLSLNLAEVFVVRLQGKRNQRWCALDNSPPRVCNPVLDLVAIAAPTSTVVTVGMLARFLFLLQQAVPETTADKQAGDKHRLLSVQA